MKSIYNPNNYQDINISMLKIIHGYQNVREENFINININKKKTIIIIKVEKEGPYITYKNVLRTTETCDNN